VLAIGATCFGEKCFSYVIYAIGDIHGQSAMLEVLLARLAGQGLNAADTVVFLGDYIDRGEDSKAVLEAVIEWRKAHANTVFLRGNHEQLVLDVLDAPEHMSREERADLALTWLRNGGAEALLSYAAPGFREWLDAASSNLSPLTPAARQVLRDSFEAWIEAIPQAHRAFLRGTAMEHVTQRYHFVHAGLLDPGRTWTEEGWSIDPRLWMREPFLSSAADFSGRIVVFGHTPQRSGRPLVQTNKIGLDTGAVFGGPLTAGIFDPDGAEPVTFIQAPYMRAVTTGLQGGLTGRQSARRRASSARSRT
jgi:serine/threonine protein phosphatase 1